MNDAALQPLYSPVSDLRTGVSGLGLLVVHPGLVFGSGTALMEDGLYTSVKTRAEGSTISSPHHLGIQKWGITDARVA